MKYKSWKLRQKILFIFAITWLVTIGTIGAVTLYGQIKDNRNSETQKNAITLSACKSLIQTKIDTINVVGKGFAVNDDVARLMSNSFSSETEENQNRILNTISRIVYDNAYIATFRTGLSVALFCSDGRTFANPNNSIVEVKVSDQSPIRRIPSGEYDILKYKIFANKTFNSADNSICGEYIRKFVLKGFSSEEGMIVLAIPSSIMQDAFSSVGSQEWAVADQNGIILASSKSENVKKNIEKIYGFSKEFGDYSSENGSISYNRGILSYNHDEKNNLLYILITPYQTMSGSLKNIAMAIIVICAVLIIVLILFSWYLSKRFTAPLDKLDGVMAAAEEGNLDARMNPELDDEIGKIGKRYDTMIEKLKDSMENIQRVEQENRKAEMRIMELQLKPHFLYNTLSSIIWLANEDKKEDVISITKSLAMFYRLSLSDGREEISVKEEIDNVRHYATIQNYRYHDKFKVNYSIDSAINEYMVPKLILQPLVENSINYGMKLRNDDDGVIEIKGYQDNQQLIFEVRDNGDNVTEQRIEQLNEALQSGTSGIGTGNVYGRIQHYGKVYMLKYVRINGYTIAIINLPIKDNTDV